MKKLVMGLMLVLLFWGGFVAMVYPADPMATVKIPFLWEQPESLADISGWSLYYSMSSGSGYIKAVDIVYPSTLVGPGPTFSYTATVYFIGPYGSTITKYFVLVARGKSGLPSGYSNEVRYDYLVPIPPSKPTNFRKGG